MIDIYLEQSLGPNKIAEICYLDFTKIIFKKTSDIYIKAIL